MKVKISNKLHLHIEKQEFEILKLPPINYEKEIEEGNITNSRKKGLQIGLHRDIAGFQDAQWRVFEGSDGRYNWRIVINSPGAVSIRPHFSRLPEGDSEVYVYGIEGVKSIEGPIKQKDKEGTWGPVIVGEYLYIEVVQSSGNVKPDLAIDKISHDFRHSLSSKVLDKRLLNTGLLKEESCYVDVNCYPEWDDVKSAVARMRYEKTRGSYACTGFMIADEALSFRNWFLTANHCISSDRVARTLISYFNYWTDDCDGEPPSLSSVPKVEGAKFHIGVSDEAGTDFTLLELSDSPPPGTVYLGWTTADLKRGETVASIHHPDGTFQRISFGREHGSTRGSNWWMVKWQIGSTEPGSSGSPLFNSKKQVVGQLNGGDSSCDDMSGLDKYGKFGVSWDLGLSNYLSWTMPSGRVPVYRFYNTNTGSHFYTIDPSERDFIIRTYSEFTYEDEAFYAYADYQDNTYPLYRFYNNKTGCHFYTIDPSERDFVRRNHPEFIYEDKAFFVYLKDSDEAYPVYRFFNTKTGCHFYTIDPLERDYVIRNFPQFRYEGRAFYAFISR